MSVVGMEELLSKIRSLPGAVVKKISDRWTLDQAQGVAKEGRKLAPRDKRRNRRKPESARLWKSIKASLVRKGLKKFPKSVSRAIAFGATVRGAQGARHNLARAAARGKMNKRRAKAPMFGPAAPRARHFVLVNTGTKSRVQRSTGRRTGVMPANPFFGRAISKAISGAKSDVNTSLAASYAKAVNAHFARMVKRMIP